MSKHPKSNPSLEAGFLWLDRPKRLGRFVLYCGPRHFVKAAKKEVCMRSVSLRNFLDQAIKEVTS